MLSHSRLSMTSERWENNFEGSKPQSFPVSRSRHQIKKYARDYYVAGQYFFNGAAYFFLLRDAAFYPPRLLIPRTAPKIYLPIQNIPEPNFYFRCRPSFQSFSTHIKPPLLEPLPKITFPPPIRTHPPNKKKEQSFDHS